MSFREFLKEGLFSKSENFKEKDLVTIKKGQYKTYIGTVSKLNGKTIYVAWTGQGTQSEKASDLKLYKGQKPKFNLGDSVVESGEGLSAVGRINCLFQDGKFEVKWNTGKYQKVSFEQIEKN